MHPRMTLLSCTHSKCWRDSMTGSWVMKCFRSGRCRCHHTTLEQRLSSLNENGLLKLLHDAFFITWFVDIFKDFKEKTNVPKVKVACLTQTCVCLLTFPCLNIYANYLQDYVHMLVYKNYFYIITLEHTTTLLLSWDKQNSLFVTRNIVEHYYNLNTISYIDTCMYYDTCYI